MPMVTRCPACRTLFRVTPEQLQARHGQVRCGRCMAVFNGFERLATLLDSPAPDDNARAAANAADEAQDETAIRATGEAATDPQGIPSAYASDGETGAAQEPPPARGAGGAAVDAHAIGTVRAPAPGGAGEEPPRFGFTPPRPASPGMPVGVAAAATISADETFLEKAHAKPRRATSRWSAGAVAALLVLGAQAAHFYRAEFSARYPVLRPAFARLCGVFGCTVPLPQRPKLINIEASDLQLIDPQRPGVIRLTATLRNHADHALAFPALDLALTSTREHTLARRVFLPEEYLDGERITVGLAASAEATVRLVLDTGDLGAAGFRLDLLPAPQR